jgi:hypothetical protein
VSKFQITRIKLNSSRVWVELNEGFDSSPFQDPLSTVPSEQQLNEVQKWCEDTQCGTRMSFDQFVFQTEKELSLFLLKWS